MESIFIKARKSRHDWSKNRRFLRKIVTSFLFFTIVRRRFSPEYMSTYFLQAFLSFIFLPPIDILNYYYLRNFIFILSN